MIPGTSGAERCFLDNAGVHSQLDYAGLGLAATAGWVGVPGLGETALIASGVLAARGRLDLAEVVSVAFVGAVMGGIAGWLLGLKLGYAVFAGPGPLRGIRLRVLGVGERFYARFGMYAVFFTPSWLAGINRMRSRPYLIVNAISAVLWAVVIGVGAYAVGPSIDDVVSDVGLGGLAVALLVAGGVELVRRSRRRRDVRD
jgi:membrane protein DedA with SNARE-associated domain